MEFQIVALKAVMADLLQGDTIHHAFNIPVYGHTFSTKPAQYGSKKEIESAKAVLQYRWIIIDEISMVSAKLLADIDTNIEKFGQRCGFVCKRCKEPNAPFRWNQLVMQWRCLAVATTGFDLKLKEIHITKLV